MCAATFNYDLFKISDDNRSLNFYDTANSLSVIPTVSKTTRITEQTSSLIDNIIINNLISFKSGIFTFDICDYLPIFIVNKSIFQILNNILETVCYRKITTNSLSNMFHAFSEINFNHLFQVDYNLAIDELHNSILNLCNHFSPIKTKSIVQKDMDKT